MSRSVLVAGTSAPAYQQVQIKLFLNQRKLDKGSSAPVGSLDLWDGPDRHDSRTCVGEERGQVLY